MHGFRVGVAILLSAWLAACAARPVPVRAASPPLPVKTIPSPACNLEGCCAGHGEVAVVNGIEGAAEQRDTTRMMFCSRAMRLRGGQ